jgi:hypothetical protein
MAQRLARQPTEHAAGNPVSSRPSGLRLTGRSLPAWVKARFRAASTSIGKVLAAVMLWAVLFGSKFLVLEVVALVFGGRVSLGGFFPVTLLILVLLLSRAAVRRLLRTADHSGRSHPAS